MENKPQENDGLAIGRYITQLRDGAKITQAELAKAVTVSPARISRIESGEIALTGDEMNQLLNAIGTEGAHQLRDYLQQNWRVLPRPRFDHPNRETLWTIDGLLYRLNLLKEDPELKTVFLRHIETYEVELNSLASHLSSVEHAIAYVGSIGVGKSTAICSMCDLRVPGDGPLNKQMVLEAGAGGTTICEVHLRSGPMYGLIVEPRTDEAIKYDVADFAEYLTRLTKTDSASPAIDLEEGPGITKEINRAIRNMSGVVESKTKDSSGRVVRQDHAKDLATKHPDVKELVVQILSLMNLPRRDRRDIWYSPGIKLSPLAWLQQTFVEINNGRHPQFSLPQRIEVVVPKSLLEDSKLDIRIVDTKGIDGAATRADLDRLFDDPRTLVVLCSRFNDAPESALQQLLQRVKDAGARNVQGKTAVVVLARPEEALAVKDNSGMHVEDEIEGYDLKRTDVEMHLGRLGLQTVPVEFFNARADDPLKLRDVLLRKVRSLRDAWAARVQTLAKTVDDLMLNHKEEQTAVIFRAAMKRLETWIEQNTDLKELADDAQQELIKAINIAHWRSVWASVRRRGEWYSLDYYYQLGFGARTVAARKFLKKAADFGVIVDNLLADTELTPAHDMLKQSKEVLTTSIDEVLKKMEIAGKTAFEDDLRADTEFWNELAAESGTGYRATIARDSDQWFRAAARMEKHNFVKANIMEAWREVVRALRDLIDLDKEND